LIVLVSAIFFKEHYLPVLILLQMFLFLIISCSTILLQRCSELTDQLLNERQKAETSLREAEAARGELRGKESALQALVSEAAVHNQSVEKVTAELNECRNK
jgi:hypothetical protein